MPLRSDYKDILEEFIYTNLPVLTNPNAAKSVVFTNTLVPPIPTVPTAATTPTTPVTPTTTPTPATQATPVIFINPGVLLALQTAVINNFNDLELPPDIQHIAQVFFANLPPIPRTPSTPVTPVTRASG